MTDSRYIWDIKHAGLVMAWVQRASEREGLVTSGWMGHHFTEVGRLGRTDSHPRQLSVDASSLSCQGTQ